MKLNKITKSLAIACAIIVGGYGSNATAATIALWTFETSIPAAAGPFAPESGAEAATSQALGGTAGTYSSPAGNGSAHSFSSNGWDVNDYYQFKFPTVGYNGLTLSFDQMGSNTGPKNFQVSTSIDGTTFTPLPAGGYSVINATWTTATPVATTSFSFALPASLEGQPFSYVRLVDTSTTSINNGTVAATGTGRVDNVQITSTEVPEPACIAMLSLAGLAAIGLVRRR